MNAASLCNEDAFPGNPDRVETAVQELSQTAQRLLQQAELLGSGLRSMATWEGMARDEFQKRVGDLPTKIQQAGERYVVGSNALSPYPTLVRQARVGQQNLCGAAQSAQQRIQNYSQALAQQRQWESAEQDRARRALTDPSQGSPIAAHWSGPDNRALLRQAEQDLSSIGHDFNTLKSNFNS